MKIKKKKESYIEEKEKEIKNNNEKEILNEEEKIQKSPYLNNKKESGTFLHCKYWSK